MKKVTLIISSTLIFGSLFAMGQKPAEPTLEAYRSKITNTDQEIIRLIAVRDGIVKKIGKYKKAHGLDIYETSRMVNLKKEHTAMAIQYDVSPEVVDNVFDVIVASAVKIASKA